MIVCSLFTGADSQVKYDFSCFLTYSNGIFTTIFSILKPLLWKKKDIHLLEINCLFLGVSEKNTLFLGVSEKYFLHGLSLS